MDGFEVPAEAVGKSWRLDETYIKIGGKDRYWYRAVDKQGNTVDFLLTATRDRRAARRFFTRAVKNSWKRRPRIDPFSAVSF